MKNMGHIAVTQISDTFLEHPGSDEATHHMTPVANKRMDVIVCVLKAVVASGTAVSISCV